MNKTTRLVKLDGICCQGFFVAPKIRQWFLYNQYLQVRVLIKQSIHQSLKVTASAHFKWQICLFLLSPPPLLTGFEQTVLSNCISIERGSVWSWIKESNREDSQRKRKREREKLGCMHDWAIYCVRTTKCKIYNINRTPGMATPTYFDKIIQD